MRGVGGTVELIGSGAIGCVGGIGATVLGSTRVPYRVGKVPGANAGRQPTLRTGAHLARGALPVLAQERLNNVVRVDILVRTTQAPVPASIHVFEKADMNDDAKKGTLAKDAAMGGDAKLSRGFFKTKLTSGRLGSGGHHFKGF